MTDFFYTDTRIHYETLGLAPGAGLRDVKKRARQLFLRYHPDLNAQNRAFCEEKTKRIAAAYSALLQVLRKAGPGAESGAEPETACSEALVFVLSHRVFALSTADVRGVFRLKDVRLEDFSMVEGAFPYICGAFYRHEELVMLWNLHEQLGLRQQPVGSDIGHAKLVHAECHGTAVGFLADDVPGMAPAQTPAPAHGPDDYVLGILDTPHGPASLLSLPALLYGAADNF